MSLFKFGFFKKDCNSDYDNFVDKCQEGIENKKIHCNKEDISIEKFRVAKTL